MWQIRKTPEDRRSRPRNNTPNRGCQSASCQGRLTPGETRSWSIMSAVKVMTNPSIAMSQGSTTPWPSKPTAA